MAVGFLNFDKKHAVAESSKLKATFGGKHIYNIQISKDLDNGTIVAKGDYIEPEIYAEKASTGFSGVILGQAGNGNYLVEVVEAGDAVLLLNVPVIYEEYTTRMQAEYNFYNAKGDVVRGYELAIGDIFALSAEGFEGQPSAGASVTVNADYKLAIA